MRAMVITAGMGLRAALVLALAAGAARADYDPSQYPAYETCALCHGLFGVSHMAKFPNLGGQKQAYIEAQLQAFIAGARDNDGGQMAAIVTELQPEDIPFVAGWFAGQEPPAPYPAEETQAGAAQVAALGCGECHGAGGDALTPHLTAQHPGYLMKQMQDFRDGRRGGAGAFHGGLLAIGDGEIEAIARYLAAEARQ